VGCVFGGVGRREYGRGVTVGGRVVPGTDILSYQPDRLSLTYCHINKFGKVVENTYLCIVVRGEAVMKEM